MSREIYIDSDCKCHVTDDGTMTAVQTDFFDGKCDELIEGYRFIPEGQSRTDPVSGRVFRGEMIAPWKPFAQLDAAQRKYEKAQLAEAQAALDILLEGGTS